MVRCCRLCPAPGSVRPVINLSGSLLRRRGWLMVEACASRLLENENRFFISINLYRKTGTFYGRLSHASVHSVCCDDYYGVHRDVGLCRRETLVDWYVDQG